MARSKIDAVSQDLVTDSGSVLWSFVKGEQLEYPVLLNFLSDANAGYTFEAVVVEALNVANQTDKPTTIKTGGVQTVLNVRKPNYLGAWNSGVAYNFEDVVSYTNGKYYKLLSGTGRMSSVTPDADPYWEETTLNRVYIQFPSTLGATWTIAPNVESNVYGFFELRVTEPNNSVFIRTWKPIRGMVELQFSPTDLVP